MASVAPLARTHDLRCCKDVTKLLDPSNFVRVQKRSQEGSFDRS